MVISKKIKVGKKTVYAVSVSLMSKNFILLRGQNGYIMCGYLNLTVAEKFKDVAVKISGAATINEALKTKAVAVTLAARKLGIFKGQPIKDVLKIIC